MLGRADEERNSVIFALILRYPVVGIVLGIGILAVGLAMNKMWLDVIAALPLAVGGYRLATWSRGSRVPRSGDGG
jgi:hypothetical protein